MVRLKLWSAPSPSPRGEGDAATTVVNHATTQGVEAAPAPTRPHCPHTDPLTGAVCTARDGHRGPHRDHTDPDIHITWWTP